MGVKRFKYKETVKLIVQVRVNGVKGQKAGKTEG